MCGEVALRSSLPFFALTCSAKDSRIEFVCIRS